MKRKDYQPAIIDHLLASKKKVFITKDFFSLFKKKRGDWVLPPNWKANDFIKYLLDEKIINRIQIHKDTSRYVFSTPSAYEIASETYKNSYFSHYTALQYHNLTKQLPKSIYITVDQPITKTAKKHADLDQTKIDSVFRSEKSKQRQIKNKTTAYENYRIYWHIKKVSNPIGIVLKSVFSEKKVGITNIERTLLDSVMRPSYSAGTHEILTAFTKAASMISINKLCSYLKKMSPIYPYHQCIGFYMDKTNCYTQKQLNLIHEFKKTYDFYLSYGIREFEYSEKWKLFYPKGL